MMSAKMAILHYYKCWDKIEAGLESREGRSSWNNIEAQAPTQTKCSNHYDNFEHAANDYTIE